MFDSGCLIPGSTTNHHNKKNTAYLQIPATVPGTAPTPIQEHQVLESTPLTRLLNQIHTPYNMNFSLYLMANLIFQL